MEVKEAAAAVRAVGAWVREDPVSALPVEPEFLINGAAPVIKDLVRNAVKK